MIRSSSSPRAAGDRNAVAFDTTTAEAAARDTEAQTGQGMAAGRSGVGMESGAVAGRYTHLSALPLDIVGLLAAGHHPGAGAVVLFSGEVRDNNKGNPVDCLEYEAYEPMAEKMIAGILTEARAKWALKAAIAVHRTGRLAIGETAVVVITAAAHREEAYAANRYIIDRIKHEAPIWKCEHFVDGMAVWGNNCGCHEKTGNVMKPIYQSDE